MAENFREYGKTVINGELEINGTLKVGSGATVTGIVKDATKTRKGVVKMATNVAEAVGDAPTATEYKALLDALKEAGIMEADPTPES